MDPSGLRGRSANRRPQLRAWHHWYRPAGTSKPSVSRHTRLSCGGADWSRPQAQYRHPCDPSGRPGSCPHEGLRSSCPRCSAPERTSDAVRSEPCFSIRQNMDPGSPNPKRKPGRPATGRDPLITLRIPEELASQIEEWCARYEGMDRSAALRILLHRGLHSLVATHLPRRQDTSAGGFLLRRPLRGSKVATCMTGADHGAGSHP